MKWLPLLALVACGDNALPDGAALAQTDDLAVVAYEDDDLVYMQPDLLERASAGGGLTNVYVTGDDEKTYAGLRAAYSRITDRVDWFCGWIEIAGHRAQHCRLASINVSLVFLGLPAGHDLLELWEGTGSDAHYDRADLVETVAEIVRETQPAAIHTLDVAATHGDDRTDHTVTGAVTLLAMARANSAVELRAYRGDNVGAEPANKAAAIYAEALAPLVRYQACAAGCAECGQACTESELDAQQIAGLQRRYAVGFRRRAAGALRTDSGCIGSAGEMRDCTGAPVWQLDDFGELRSGEQCLAASDDGSIAAAPCAGGPERHWFVDDEGHIWSGLPPNAEPGARLRCLAPAGAVTCGRDFAPTWEFVPPVVTSHVTFGASGRAVRIGDLTGDGRGDLCAVGLNGLLCAPGDGGGKLGFTIRIDDPTKPLRIMSDSLAIGDVDGDHRDDACGIAFDGTGLVCATAASGFKASAWTPLFGLDAVDGTAASLAAVDERGPAFLCGLASEGVQCQPPSTTLGALALSSWPAANAVVWPGELDDDGYPDWCTPSEAGAKCGAYAEAYLTSDGVPWTFSQDGVVEPIPTDAATGALADIDGDGRADLCGLEAGRVTCARSQGRGFGPRFTVMSLAAPATALWLGDLNGDRHADVCVDTGSAVTCALSP